MGRKEASKHKHKDPDNCKPVMFNRERQAKRLGSLHKSSSLYHLKPVEELLCELMKDYYPVEWCYDVNAQEIPWFRTLNYTEYAHSLIVHPLNEYLKSNQLRSATDGSQTIFDDWCTYFRSKIGEGTSNKYAKRDDSSKFEHRKALCVLVGSNKIKERLCLNKLRHIQEVWGDEVWFKPHPITTHQIIGELKDMMGEDNILPRNCDVYYFLRGAEKVYTTHMSETALYATVLGKEIEPMEVIQHVHQGSFYWINRYLFDNCAHGKSNEHFINYGFSNYRSGIFNPEVDRDWESKLERYLKWIMGERELYKTWYIDGKEKYRRHQNI